MLGRTCYSQPSASLVCFLGGMIVRYYFMLEKDLLSLTQSIIVNHKASQYRHSTEQSQRKESPRRDCVQWSVE